MAKGKTKAAGLPWEMIGVPLVNLHLDLQNYRHEEVQTESDAIALLYSEEKVEALARDIVEQGTLSPLDLIGVVPMEGNTNHFTAVEGNRRLCALLLLNDSDRAPTPQARTQMKALAKRITMPTSITVVKFESKAKAKHWIDLRHLGPQDGQGPRPWNPTQKDRATDDGGPNKLAVAVLTRATDGDWLTEGNKPAVTTLTRYLKNREVRAALGLGHHRDLIFTHDSNEVDVALRQFLLDALPTDDGSDARVNSRSNDADRAAYAREFRTRGLAPANALQTPVAPAPATPPPRGAGTNQRNRPDPSKRKYLVDDFVCNANNNNLRLLFREMKRTEITDHEFANVFMLRAFIEQVMKLYLKQVDPGNQPPTDQQTLVARCSQKLDPTQKSAKFKALRMSVSDSDKGHSLHSLGSAVHLGILVNRGFLISAWENWKYALAEMLKAIPTK